MKTPCLFLCVLLTLVLFGCEKAPAEQTVPTTAPTQTTAPVETTPPTTLPPETVPPETFPKYEINVATDAVVKFADALYVLDPAEENSFPELPEDYVFVGNIYIQEVGKLPEWLLNACNVPAATPIYASLGNSAYIYYREEADGTAAFRRMVRADLAGRPGEKVDPEEVTPDNYTQLFFDTLLNGAMVYNYYNKCAFIQFEDYTQVDLVTFFYSGFLDLSQSVQPLTSEEKAFLTRNGWGDNKPVSNALRLPEDRLAETFHFYFDADLTEPEAKLWDTYWAEAGCYYTWRSDVLSGHLDISQIHMTDLGVVEISYQIYMSGKPTHILRLQRLGDRYVILSNMPA